MNMKAGIVLVIVSALMFTCQLRAQQPGQGAAPKPQIEAPISATALTPALDQATQPLQSEAITTKNLQITGPLVQPFKAKKFHEFPKRLLHLVNPFARSQPKQQTLDFRDYNPRAWASSISWRPGASAFADPVTHESSMGLFSVGPR